MAVRTHKPHTVYTRSSWGDAWVEVPYLYCSTCTFASAPSTNSAILEYQYGRKERPDNLFFANYTQLDLTDKYVKVAITGGPTWYGICIDNDDQRLGEAVYNGNTILAGTQTFQCRGMEYLLQRDPITTSIVKDAAAAGGEKTINRAIGFNLGAGLPGSAYREANAALVAGNNNTAIFTDDLMQATTWSADMILAYLVENLFPRSPTGLENIGWTFNNAVIRQYLAPYKPAMQIHGKTAFQILNELIDRRRLLGWGIEVDPNVEVPEIRVYSFNANNVLLPPGQDAGDPISIPQNGGQFDWDFDTNNLVQVCVLATDAAAKFDQVTVRGEPPGAVFTAQMPGGGGNGKLEIDWTAAQQVIYNDGATATVAGAAHYAGLGDDPYAKHNAHQTARSKDSVKKVYRYFRIISDFSGFIGAFGVWPIEGDPLTCQPFWLPGIRLQNYLPLRLEHDYTNVAAITNDVKTKSKWEYQRPFAFIQDANGKYFFLDRAGRGEEMETHLQSSGRFWSANIRMQDEAPGIIVDVSGAPQHAIAKNTWTANDPDDETDYDSSADYNYLGATVFAECDGQVTVSYPTNVFAPVDVLKVLNIYAPNCRFDYLVPGTVIDIGADGTLQTSEGGLIQDDTTYMKNLARSSYEWYGQTRQALQVTLHDLGYLLLNNALNGLPEVVGLSSLIRSIGTANPQAVNSVVTSIEFDLLAGTSTYLTQFAELDL